MFLVLVYLSGHVDEKESKEKKQKKDDDHDDEKGYPITDAQHTRLPGPVIHHFAFLFL